MSLQPLITVAFSSIYTPPAPYGARRSPTIGDAPVWTARRAEEAVAASATFGIERTNEGERTQDVRKSEPLPPARDAGKPMSASGDVLDFSDAAKKLDKKDDAKISLQQEEPVEKETEKSLATSPNAGQLSPEDQQKVDELKARDAEVRTHEAAHLAAAGSYATSGASFTYETGPDGNKYAVGGEVSISTSPVKDDPEATLEKAQTIQRAALAPAQPSDQDRRVAAAAAQMAAEAQQELARQNVEQSPEPEDTEQTDSAFQLIREAVSSKPASSPAASYAAQSVMASRTGNFSAYA